METRRPLFKSEFCEDCLKSRAMNMMTCMEYRAISMMSSIMNSSSLSLKPVDVFTAEVKHYEHN